MADVKGIPLVDFGGFAEHTGAERAATVAALGASLERYGFVAISGHGVPTTLLDEAYAVAAQVFALPEAAKRRCETPEDARQRGYTPYLLEKAKDQAAPDLKEFWHVGQELAADHPMRLKGLMGPNQVPAELPEFGAVMNRLFAAQMCFAELLLDAIAEYLGAPRDLFRGVVKDGNHVLRVINYPDVHDGPAGAVRAAAHEDINLLTVLPSATRPGLQVLDKDGQWIAIEATPGIMICDTGDMMEVLSGGRLPAVTHRVVNPPGGADGGRLSMPFFMHPNPEARLAPFDSDEPGVRAHDFLMARLVANNVA
jgi:isopenicillin N synthase-like dioxygenase